MWRFSGTSATIGWHDEAPEIWGCSPHQPRLITASSAQVLRYLSGTEMLWSIHPCSGPEERIDPNSSGFFEQVAGAPQHCHFAISYFGSDSENQAAVGCVICLPDDLFGQQFGLWQQQMFAQNHARFYVTLSFLGFRTAGAHTTTPTVEEWVGEEEKPIMGTGVKIAFARLSDSAATVPQLDHGPLQGLRRAAKRLVGSGR